ncbi:MAG TPA: hypothetical protein VJH05_01780 [Candidatus Paceibacterota bacterium]
MEYIFRKDNEKLFYEHWNKFTAGAQRHSYFNIESWLLISRFKNLFVDDLSFVALENGEVVSCAFLPIENHQYKKVAIDGDYVFAPIAKRGYEKETYAKIDELAREHNILALKFLVDPPLSRGYNHLQQYDFLDTSVLDYRIDLVDDFLNECRKGHRSDIKTILNDKKIVMRCYDSKNPSLEAHEGYRYIHKKQAGKETRPKETFDLQYERLKNGGSVLAELEYEGKKIAYAYFDYEGKWAYYSSSAGDPDFKEIRTSHALVFAAAEFLKNKGVKHIIVEQPAGMSAQYDSYPSEKELNIARFKRGFSGDFVMDFRGIKYYSKEAFQKDAQLFTEQYWGNK